MKDANSPNQSDQENRSLSNELRLLGENLRKIVNSAWEIEERKKLEEDLAQELNDLNDSLQRSINEFSQSRTGQRIVENLEELNTMIRDEKVEEKVRSGAINLLQKIRSWSDKKNSKSEDPDDFSR